MNKSRQNRLILGTLAPVLGGAPRFYAQQAETQSPSTTSSQGKPQSGPRAGESSSNDAQAQPSDNGEMVHRRGSEVGRHVRSSARQRQDL